MDHTRKFLYRLQSMGATIGLIDVSTDSLSKGVRSSVFEKSVLTGLLYLLSGIAASAPVQATDTLVDEFRNPPEAAKPRVWWHWMNGNVTREGIQRDLEWMHRIGLGGFQNFDVALGTSQWVPQRTVYMSPEWSETFRFTTQIADELGLEEAIASSPGWSESGGPWVEPRDGMKKVVWSETTIEGGAHYSAKLPSPPRVTGPFQNISLLDFMAPQRTDQPTAPPPTFYADIAVVAYHEVGYEGPVKQQPKITASDTIDSRLLADGDLDRYTSLPKGNEAHPAWIQYQYPRPHTLYAVTLVLNDPALVLANASGNDTVPPLADLQASEDGLTFHNVVSIPGNGSPAHTIAFPKTTARYFRVKFIDTEPVPPSIENIVDAHFDFHAPPTSVAHQIAELVLHANPRINRFEEKAGFATLTNLDSFPTPEVNANEATRPQDILDLTSQLRPDGTLDWTPPPGRWTVLRMGYSLTGVTNHPASLEGTGLEVDKLDRTAVRKYLSHYLDLYQDALGPLMGKRGLRYMVSDSWEAGSANWTEGMLAEFTRRRGYDPRRWLPTLTGRVVESATASDHFLWDFRKTLAELLTENHYDQFAEILHQRGMGHYAESHEEGRAFIGDGMEAKRNSDIPMAAMWTQSPGVLTEQYGYNADILESAAVSHIYGQNLVAAESLTALSGAWTWSPATLKPTADKEMALGVNRFVIHTSVHQPFLDRTPGLALGPFGQWFTRNETWAEQAQPWIAYLSRSCYLLQQGRFVADVLYFYGEDSNITNIFADHSPAVPEGYSFDYINGDALIHRLTVENDNRLQTPSGMQYRVLTLDPRSRQMSVAVLRKLHELVESGAIVVGARPDGTPSLGDSEAEFRTLANILWPLKNPIATVGKGRVFSQQSTAQVLNELGVSPDFSYDKLRADDSLLFVHRKLPEGDLYFVDNRNDRAEQLNASFRVRGREPEIWHADTGLTEAVSYTISNGQTIVPLHLDGLEALFVVFRKPTTNRARQLPTPIQAHLATLEGPWDVSFQPDRGAPDRAEFAALTSWSQNADEGIKYFSGTATYTKRIRVPATWRSDHATIWMDLGSVKNLAEVTINGHALGVAWKPPYRVNVTPALKTGDNTLVIKVTNGWANRLIGDRQPGAKRYTFTSPVYYKAQSPLQPSGLLGPVIITSTRLVDTGVANTAR